MRTMQRLTLAGLTLTGCGGLVGVAVSLLALTGCGGLGGVNQLASTGWRFEIGKPATISSPVTVEQTSGPLAVGGVAAGPVGPTVAGPRAQAMLFAAQQPLDPCVPYGQPGPSGGRTLAQLAPDGSCTVDDLCRRQANVEQALQKLLAQRPTVEPMPTGKP